MEVRHTIPHQLHGDRENQKTEDFVNRADCARPETPYQRSTQQEE
jgi:hypothetical protein